MPKVALVLTLHAESALVVRTGLLGVGLSLDRMAEDAGILLVTLAILDEKGANRHLFRVEPVQVAALVTFLACTAEPMNAHFGLFLALVLLLAERRDYLLDFVDGDLGSLVRRVVHGAATHAEWLDLGWGGCAGLSLLLLLGLLVSRVLATTGKLRLGLLL